MLFGVSWAWVIRLIIPAINAELAAIGHGIFKLAAVDRTTVGGQLTTEVRVEVLAGFIEGCNIAIATATLTVGLGVVGVQVVAARECTVAARDPAHMRLLLGVALHVPLEMFLALETTLAARLLALELHLLNDRRQVLEAESGSKELFLRGFARRLAMTLHQAITVDRREGELVLVLAVGHAADGSIRARRGAHGNGAVRGGRSVGLESRDVGGELGV